MPPKITQEIQKKDIFKVPSNYPGYQKITKSAVFIPPEMKNLGASQNLEYKLHNENKSDYGDDNEKHSYISVKLEPKVADSNLSSPTGEDKAKRKRDLNLREDKESFGYNEFTTNLMKGDKKNIEYCFVLS